MYGPTAVEPHLSPADCTFWFQVFVFMSCLQYVFDDLVACFQYVSKVQGVLPLRVPSSVVVVESVLTRVGLSMCCHSLCVASNGC
jgi:hypothetical protein